MLQHKQKTESDRNSNSSTTSSGSGGSYLSDNRKLPLQLKKNNQTGLPDQLKTGIESLSGFSMDDVKVHYNSSKPAQLNAHAYAQGTEIHLASGQEKHLPHEAWHIVQQKQGRVKPTMQMKGKVNINDDEGLEKEADVMGTQAVRFLGKSQFQSTLTNTYMESSNVHQRVTDKELGVAEYDRLVKTMPARLKGAAIDLGYDPPAVNAVLGWITSTNVTVDMARAILHRLSIKSIDLDKAALVYTNSGDLQVPLDHIREKARIDGDPKSHEIADGLTVETRRDLDIPRVRFDRMEELGAGRMGSTSMVTSSDFKGQKVFKPETADGRAMVGASVGIPSSLPRAAARSEAVSVLSQHLGLSVISHTQTVRTPDGRKGSLMDLARGKELNKYSEQERRMLFQNPMVKKGLSELQLIDYLTGEIDRHNNNIFIAEDGQVTGIDNDTSFGVSSTSDSERRQGHNKGIPAYLGANLAQRILELDLRVLHGLLGHLLTPAEIENVNGKLERLKEKIERALQQRRYVPGGWANVDADALARSGKSYFNYERHE